ncbi:MAG: BrnA antitoxin family protein [Polaromonas sp.]
MSENAKTSNWVDPDDAPELGAEFFKSAKRMVGGKEVSEAEFQAAKKRMGRPPVEVKRPTLSMRIDPDVLEALKASGKGWQTRVNAILRHKVLGK